MNIIKCLATYIVLAFPGLALLAQADNVPHKNVSVSQEYAHKFARDLATYDDPTCPTTPVIPRNQKCSTSQSVTFLPKLSAAINQEYSAQIGNFTLCNGAVIRFADHYVDWGDEQKNCSITPYIGSERNGELTGSHIYNTFGPHRVWVEIPGSCIIESLPDHYDKSCGVGNITVYNSLPLKSFTLSAANVEVGNQKLTGTVVFKERAGADFVLIDVVADIPNVIYVSAPVLSDALADSATFTIVPIGATPPKGAKITVTSGGTSLSRTLTVRSLAKR